MLEKVGWLFAVVALFGCGGTSTDGTASTGKWVLTARAGRYTDGSGRIGLSILATLRDPSGNGPSQPWTVSLSDEVGDLGIRATYDAQDAGSYALWWFPEVAASSASTYSLALRSEDGVSTLETQLTLPTQSPNLGLAQIEMDASADHLSWTAVPGAASYRCEVTAGGLSQLDHTSTTPGCDTSALPPGGYQASIFSFASDLASLGADDSQSPSLPPADLSESRLSFVRTDGGAPALRFAAAGGRFDYGGGSPGLVMWLSLAGVDGGTAAQPVNVTVSGPGIPSGTPLEIEYPQGVPQAVFWSYDVGPSSGLYSAIASVGSTEVATQFGVADADPLPVVLDATASGASSGGATVNWTPIPSAQSYFVGAWSESGTAGQFVFGQWTSSPPFSFPSQTFTAGASYDVYVTALDVPFPSSGIPQNLRASQNAYAAAHFTGE